MSKRPRTCRPCRGRAWRPADANRAQAQVKRGECRAQFRWGANNELEKFPPKKKSLGGNVLEAASPGMTLRSSDDVKQAQVKRRESSPSQETGIGHTIRLAARIRLRSERGTLSRAHPTAGVGWHGANSTKYIDFWNIRDSKINGPRDGAKIDVEVAVRGWSWGPDRAWHPAADRARCA